MLGSILLAALLLAKCFAGGWALARIDRRVDFNTPQ
jgi:hypothetical protein